MSRSEPPSAESPGPTDETREERHRRRALAKDEKLRTRVSSREGRTATRSSKAKRPEAEDGCGELREGAKRSGPRASEAVTGPSEPSTARLEAFAAGKIDRIRKELGPIRFAPWPRIEGCLCLLFTSRSGSTFLTRELEMAFKIGRMREALNPPQVKGVAAGRIVSDRRAVEGARDPWFSFKAGGSGVIAAELSGFFDAYLHSTSFILLVRRDIVAQAISREKALQTGQYHSTQAPKAAAEYDRGSIAHSIDVIASGVQKLRNYIERAGRPWRPLVYETFSRGDLTSALEACDSLGLPRREATSEARSKKVERIGDAINVAWAARFRDEMGADTRVGIEAYLAAISSEGLATPPLATPIAPAAMGSLSIPYQANAPSGDVVADKAAKEERARVRAIRKSNKLKTQPGQVAR